jgi:uncharacterized membrane protein YqhA
MIARATTGAERARRALRDRETLDEQGILVVTRLPTAPARATNTMSTGRMQRLIGFARFLAILGVASSILLAGALFLSAFVRAVILTVDSVRSLGREGTPDQLIVAAVEHADALLIATGLLVVGIGLYSIFIKPVERLPTWLVIVGLDDLKDKLAGVVVVALAVHFFSVALEYGGTGNILEFGLAIAAVILGVTAYTSLHPSRRSAARADGSVDDPASPADVAGRGHDSP